MLDMLDNLIQIIAGNVNSNQLEDYNNDAFKQYNDKALEPCPNCGRTFLPDRLIVHLKSCKGDGKSSPHKMHGSPDKSNGKFSQSMKVQSPGDVIS